MKAPMTLLGAMLALLLSACSSTPKAEPEPIPKEAPKETPRPTPVARVDVHAVTGEIAARILAGDVAGAEAQLARLDRRSDRDTAFTSLYDRGQALCDERDYDASARINRFLVAAFDANAAREAMVYSMWLSRAATGAPHDPASRAEIARTAARLRADDSAAPVWVEIALTQAAIDGGDLASARSAYGRFQARWDGEPATLRDYPRELGRYLESHPDAN
jgi:hypothetical protein